MTDERINNETVLIRTSGAPYLCFDALREIPFIKHGFSTRLGGVSEGCFGAMNLGFDRGDDNAHVHENFELIAKSIGFDASRLVFTDQWHTTNIRVATQADCGKGIFRERTYENIDGHITDIPGVVLLAYGADCAPVYLVDKKRHAIGLCHSGWKGTLNKISRVTLEAMRNQYGTKTEDVTAVVGPCICRECYEIGSDVADAFYADFAAELNSDPKLLAKGRKEGKYQLSLADCIRVTLENAGVKSENIHLSGVCTMENKELMFSHRRDGAARGSMAAFLTICE